MRKFIFMALVTATFSYSNNIGNYTLIGKCNEILFTKIVYEKHISYDGISEMGLQFGLKSKSSSDLKYKINAYLKDDHNKTINDTTIKSGVLKSNYEDPFSKITYYVIGAGLSTFSGNIDLEIICTKIQKEPASKNPQNEKIILNKNAFKIFDNKTTFEASAMTGVLLKTVEKHGGVQAFIKKASPCLNK